MAVTGTIDIQATAVSAPITGTITIQALPAGSRVTGTITIQAAGPSVYIRRAGVWKPALVYVRRAGEWVLV